MVWKGLSYRCAQLLIPSLDLPFSLIIGVGVRPHCMRWGPVDPGESELYLTVSTTS